MSRRSKPDPRDLQLLGRWKDAQENVDRLLVKLMRVTRALDKAKKSARRHRKQLDTYRLERSSQDGKKGFEEGLQ